MSKLIKIIWSLCSLAPFLFVLSIVYGIDFFSKKELTSSLWPSIIFIGLVVLSFVLIKLLLWLSRKKLEPTHFPIKEIESKDQTAALTLISYLITISTVNQITMPAFYAMIGIVLIMLITTKIVFINPLLYFFGYRYYKIKAQSGVFYTIISKTKRVNPDKIDNMVEIFSEIYLEVWYV